MASIVLMCPLCRSILVRVLSVTPKNVSVCACDTCNAQFSVLVPPPPSPKPAPVPTAGMRCVLPFPVSRWRDVVYPLVDDGSAVKDMLVRAPAPE